VKIAEWRCRHNLGKKPGGRRGSKINHGY
jgi:hypothetical protein